MAREVGSEQLAREAEERARRQALDESRASGQSDAAISILHNVGNVLTSVNVSANLIQSKLRALKVESVSKLAELVTQHRDDLAEFLTQDARGEKVAAFLRELSQHLLAQKAGLAEEVDSLLKNLGHLKGIVSAQQRYASRLCGVVEQTSLQQLVEHALAITGDLLAANAIDVVQRHQEIPPVALDRNRVLEILVNLVTNAGKALAECDRPDRTLTVATERNGDQGVRISISDNGVGIRTENLTRIFQQGFTTRHDGHGLGLHTSANAAKRLGGQLSCHSDGPGTGATFHLDLPARCGDRAP